MKPVTFSVAALVAVLWPAGHLVAARQGPAAGATPTGQKAEQPWPNARTIAERKKDAENRRLFRSSDVLTFSLVADFKAVDRDRDPTSTKTFPATIVLPQADGTTVSRPIQIRGRGHSRRDPRICDFVPLRLEFAKGQMAGTELAGHSALKLGTHCGPGAVFEQYVLREYTAYKIFTVLTPQSFRVRLARATYVNSSNQKPIATRFALFTEDDDDVARRMEGRSIDRRRLLFKHVDPEYTTLMAVFEFMIGNTDLSIFALHNVRVVETRDGRLYPVPYDLDYSGLVNTRYAAVDPLFPIESVRERLYRGPCLPVAEFDPFFAKFRAAKAAIMALYDQLPSLTQTSRNESKAYLESFYKLIEEPGDVKRAFVDVCVRGGPARQVGM